MSTPLPDWTTRDSFRRDPHQRHIARTNELSNLTPPAGGEVLRTPFGTGTNVPPVFPRFEVARFQVSTASYTLSNQDRNFVLAKAYKADGISLETAETPILRRGPHYVGQDIIAARVTSRVTTPANDLPLYSAVAPTGVYAPLWEEVHQHELVLVWVPVNASGEGGTSYTTHGGWYNGFIITNEEHVVPTGGTDTGLPAADTSTDNPCVFFNWYEQGWGAHWRGQTGCYVWGAVVEYTNDTPPKPIVFAVGGIPPKEGITAGTATVNAWARRTAGDGSNITVLVDATLTINFAAQTFTFTKHFQTVKWDGYGWVYEKTAST